MVNNNNAMDKELKRKINVMINEVIKSYGLQTKQTIHFCKLCEKGKINTITKKYSKLMGF